jgi:mannose-6-phosphate isomerase-like protein (cupin superfamily)
MAFMTTLNHTIHRTIQTIVARGGEAYQVMADQVIIKIPGEATNGAYTVVEVISPPGGGPPALHTHQPQETFYILEGVATFETLHGGELVKIEAKPGDIVHIPGMTPHTYRNYGSQPLHFITLISPACMDRFFAELGVHITDPANPPRPSGPPDMARVLRIAAKHGIEFVGPRPDAAP